MKSALTKRVLDMVAQLAADEPEKYRKFWSHFGQVLKEGFVEDRQNADKLLRLMRFTTTRSDGPEQEVSLTDYLSRASDDQDKIYYLLAENYATAKSSPHLESLRKQDIEVLLLHDRIDPWMVDHLPEFEGKSFHDVGRGDLKLPEGDGKITREAQNKEHKAFLKKLRKTLRDRVEEVNVSQRLVDSPACVVASETDLPPQLRRMLEASGQAMPDSKPQLEINMEHPLVKRLAAEADEGRFTQLAHIVLDHALLAEGTQLEDPATYVRRINELLLAMQPGEAA